MALVAPYFIYEVKQLDQQTLQLEDVFPHSFADK